ncbi:hypothetical protein [Halomonas elongata]|uniref:Small CPxCG-related zinc finger protein n=1 Tax=Halomonas elongata (strain ATCC 33173 / DSM 2581 / NBRC 15536 / NCIMB 2198 / 1H9) TaxID=768066 RepID=A0ABZ0TA04_HALED|nr:hypothetical protein [Halomonas elongata]WBF19247.1 hypothetical protein LM502_06030 [Halomonas elongata]WPU48107.1 hypothetical protein SR933_04255 [Halomonas elongata DSM 2581]
MGDRYQDMTCDACGKTYNTAWEGVTTNLDRELCGECSWSGERLLENEFIPD